MPDSGLPSSNLTPPPLIPLIPGAKRLMQRVTYSCDLERDLQDLIEHEPKIDRINQRLAAYLPAVITQTYSRELLLASCLKAGIDAAPSGTPDRTERYLDALTEAAVVVLRYNLVAPTGRWNPLYDPPLMVWMQKHKGSINSSLDEPWPPIALNDFKRGLLQRLVGDTVSTGDPS